MPQDPHSSETPETADPYRSTASGPGDLGPITPPPPPILWILPGSILSIMAFSTAAGIFSVPFGEAIAVPALVVWLGLLGWSLWVTLSRQGGMASIFARSYLMAHALVALLVGVIGTSCAGLTLGASSGKAGEIFLWILLCIGAIALALFLFRWPRRS